MPGPESVTRMYAHGRPGRGRFTHCAAPMRRLTRVRAGIRLVRRPADHGHLAAGRRELHRIREQIHEDLTHASLIADIRGARRVVHSRSSNRMPFAVACGWTSAAAATTAAPVIEHILPNIESVRIDLRDIEHIVHQLQQMTRARLQPLEMRVLRRRGGAEHAHVEQLRVAEDRVERGAELVAHRREELRFSTAGLLRRDDRRVGCGARGVRGSMQPRALDRHRRPAREILGHLPVAVAEAAAFLRRDIGDRAQHGPMRDHRHAQVRVRAQPLEQCELLGVARALREHIRGNVGGDVRTPFANDTRDIRQVGRKRTISIAQRARRIVKLGIRMVNADSANLTIIVDHVQDHPRIQIRGRHARNGRERLFVIERGGERAARLREKGEPILSGGCRHRDELWVLRSALRARSSCPPRVPIARCACSRGCARFRPSLPRFPHRRDHGSKRKSRADLALRRHALRPSR